MARPKNLVTLIDNTVYQLLDTIQRTIADPEDTLNIVEASKACDLLVKVRKSLCVDRPAESDLSLKEIMAQRKKEQQENE